MSQLKYHLKISSDLIIKINNLHSKSRALYYFSPVCLYMSLQCCLSACALVFLYIFLSTCLHVCTFSCPRLSISLHISLLLCFPVFLPISDPFLSLVSLNLEKRLYPLYVINYFLFSRLNIKLFFTFLNRFVKHAYGISTADVPI